MLICMQSLLEPRTEQVLQQILLFFLASCRRTTSCCSSTCSSCSSCWACRPWEWRRCSVNWIWLRLGACVTSLAHHKVELIFCFGWWVDWLRSHWRYWLSCQKVSVHWGRSCCFWRSRRRGRVWRRWNSFLRFLLTRLLFSYCFGRLILLFLHLHWLELVLFHNVLYRLRPYKLSEFRIPPDSLLSII